MSIALKDTGAGRVIGSADRERRKRLWLDPVFADLRTAGALAVAKEHHVSLRLARMIAGFVANLSSFLDAGYVYPSQVGLAGYIKGTSDQPMSDRQVRRGIAFMEARGHLRIVRLRGTRNSMYPLYRAPETAEKAVENVPRAPDMMSSEGGHGVRRVRTWCPPKPSNKPIYKTEESPLPPNSTGNVLTLVAAPIATPVVETAERAAASGQPMKEEKGEDDPTFEWFWNACSRVGLRGPAQACWRRLTPADWYAIRDLDDACGGLDLQGVWACTWLKDRQWEIRPCPATNVASHPVALLEIPALRRRVVWSPNDPEFKAEYARRLEVGEDVCVMEGAMRRGGRCTLDL